MPGQHLNDTERRLRERWEGTFGPSLRSIEIAGSPLRGISAVTLDLRYPFVVLAGKNGTGKSTFLACAACAYRHSGKFDSFFFTKKYFNFNDLFINSAVDSGQENVVVRWSYRLQSGGIAVAPATKDTTRWRGYRKRPERTVEFLGLARAVHPAELRALRHHFGKDIAIAPVSLGDALKEFVSCIMKRNYSDVKCATQGRYSLHVLKSGDGEYSGFHAGSGEDISCVLSRVLERLPDNSLLVIEEIETGLHPAAQRQLVSRLLDLCLKKKLQVICSSHSQAVLETVPRDARVLLARYGSFIQPRYSVSVAEALGEMTDVPMTELRICVEDAVAERLVLESLPAGTRQRVRVISCGNWDDVIRFLAMIRRDPSLGGVLGILDGDRGGKDEEHRQSLAKYVGGKASDEDWQWLEERLDFLPGGVAPEALFRRVGEQAAYRALVAKELNADPGVIGAFLDSFVGDDHNLPYELGRRVGLDEGRVLIALSKAACVEMATEFEAVNERVRDRIEADAA